MNVFPLPLRNRSSGTTALDARQASRFVFARPGWRLAERRGTQHEAYLEISVDRPETGPPLTWHLFRSEACIIIQNTGTARKVGPYASIHDALLAIWEDAERTFARLQDKPSILLFGLDPISLACIQDLALIVGFDPQVVSDPQDDSILSAEIDLAAAVLDLQVSAFGGDGREVIRRIRQCRPRLPVLALTIHPHTAPEADLHGLGGPTQRERRPFDPDRVLHWLRGVHDAHGGSKAATDARSDRGPA